MSYSNEGLKRWQNSRTRAIRVSSDSSTWAFAFFFSNALSLATQPQLRRKRKAVCRIRRTRDSYNQFILCNPRAHTQEDFVPGMQMIKRASKSRYWVGWWQFAGARVSRDCQIRHLKRNLS